jgi:hypothetical protein
MPTAANQIPQPTNPTATRAAHKRVRPIQLTDELYEAYEELAASFDCSVDFLVATAMKRYLRMRRSLPAKVQSTFPAPPTPTPTPSAPPTIEAAPDSGSPPTTRWHRTPAPPASHIQQTGAAPVRLLIHVMGERIEVRGRRATLGRSRKNCDVVVSGPGVSRQHALVEWCDGDWFIIDMSTRNGTWRRNMPITRSRIIEGEPYELGNQLVSFELS